MADINTAVSWALKIAADDSHGYDQANRNGPDYDCSSFVGTALSMGGFSVSPSSTTRNLYQQLIASGFKTCANPYKKGDIHLTPGRHVVMSISENEIVHASINENGDITGGKTGDQTGKEICTRSFYTPSYGWSYHLRYNGGKKPKNVNTDVPAKSFSRSIAGSYLTTDRLNIRRGPSANYESYDVLPNGTSVRNYGYYTGNWYLVVAIHGTDQYTGYVHKDFLKKA